MAEEKKPAEQMTEEELRAAVKALEAEKTTGFEVKLETGQVYKGANEAEVLKQLVDAQTNASKTIKQQKDEFEAYKKTVEAQQKQTQQVVNPSANGDKFNAVEYYKLFEQDPMAAQNYIDQFRYGIPIDELKQQWEHAIEVANEFDQHKAVALFHAKHPEFPGGEEAATMLLGRLAERQQDISYDALNTAYLELRYEGKIKPVEETMQQTTSTTEPAPTLPSGTIPQATPGGSVDVSGMSDADLEALLRKTGMLK